MTPLNDSNFLLYAAKNYINAHYDTDEFYDDLNRFKYIKKLFSRYLERGELRERLILNHIITVYNVFEHSAATRMLFYKTDESQWHILKTILLFLQYMPPVIYNIEFEGNHIRSDLISIDLRLATKLREL